MILGINQIHFIILMYSISEYNWLNICLVLHLIRIHKKIKQNETLIFQYIDDCSGFLYVNNSEYYINIKRILSINFMSFFYLCFVFLLFNYKKDFSFDIYVLRLIYYITITQLFLHSLLSIFLKISLFGLYFILEVLFATYYLESNNQIFYHRLVLFCSSYLQKNTLTTESIKSFLCGLNNILNRNIIKNKFVRLTSISEQTNELDKECSICLQEDNNEKVKLECSHIYHKKCIVSWLCESDNCPLCRKVL